MERRIPWPNLPFLDPAAAALPAGVAQAAGKPVEEVLADALFKLAGELSLRPSRPGHKKWKSAVVFRGGICYTNCDHLYGGRKYEIHSRYL